MGATQSQQTFQGFSPTHREGAHQISDIVAMLEAWEAKEKRDAKPVFEVLAWKIGGGFYVKVTLPNVAPENITGFETKNEAIRWVRNESAAWLQARRKQIAS